jgi:Zn-dependent protease with chaperone function
VSTQFFERQEVQRSQTRWLVLAFIAAFLLVTVVVNLVVVVGLIGHPGHVLREHPGYIAWISIVVIGTMLIATWHRASQLRAGGAVVARSLGGVPVGAKTPTQAQTPAQHRRRNGDRGAHPQAAGVRADGRGVHQRLRGGHSPDDAAVAVTQGALDKLDRDQLQAVIGHEFSHILNGDMKINMQLTVWIFGLFVITDLAVRIMNKRGGGKNAARLKLVAFGVFLAGSVGLFAGRLLQAAVSRRREHLADASAVQFTRNPQALQGAFIAMAATAEGSTLVHATRSTWRTFSLRAVIHRGRRSSAPLVFHASHARGTRPGAGLAHFAHQVPYPGERREAQNRCTVAEEAKAAEEAARAAEAAKAAAIAAGAAQESTPTFLDVPLDGLAHLAAPFAAAAATESASVRQRPRKSHTKPASPRR